MTFWNNFVFQRRCIVVGLISAVCASLVVFSLSVAEPFVCGTYSALVGRSSFAPRPHRPPTSLRADEKQHVHRLVFHSFPSIVSTCWNKTGRLSPFIWRCIFMSCLRTVECVHIGQCHPPDSEYEVSIELILRFMQLFGCRWHAPKPNRKIKTSF